MKKLNDLTIKEYNEYLELLGTESHLMNNGILFQIMELFGFEDVEEMSVEEMNKAQNWINMQTLEPAKIKRYYIINGKRYYPTLNLTKFKAAQFIDLQTFIAEGKIEKILGAILLPTKRTWLFKYKKMKYSENYDYFEVVSDIYNNMKIGDAQAISAFFLKTSETLLRTIQVFSHRRLMKMKLKQQKQEIKKLNMHKK